MGALLVSAPQYDSVLLNITMSLHSLFADIFSKDEDPADSMPTDSVDDLRWGCAILWFKSRFFDDRPRWASFSPVYYINSVDR